MVALNSKTVNLFFPFSLTVNIPQPISTPTRHGTTYLSIVIGCTDGTALSGMYITGITAILISAAKGFDLTFGRRVKFVCINRRRIIFSLYQNHYLSSVSVAVKFFHIIKAQQNRRLPECCSNVNIYPGFCFDDFTCVFFSVVHCWSVPKNSYDIVKVFV